VQVVITLGEIIFIIFVLFIVASIFFVAIYNWLKGKFNRKYRQNCIYCEHYKQTGVNGDYTYHKCDLHNYSDTLSQDDMWIGKYRKCSDYKGRI